MPHSTLTLYETIEFLNILINKIGLGFHPDNAIRHYVKADGAPTFSIEALEIYQSMLNACFAFCEANEDYDIYDLAVETDAYRACIEAHVKTEEFEQYDPELAAMGAYTT